MAEFQDIVVEHFGPVARISHNRPAQRNAQGEQLLGEMGRAVRQAGQDEAVRVIIIAGKGEHFSAGHDLKTVENNGQGYTVEERFAFEQKFYFDICMDIWDAPKPTIASVQGACIAGAFALANMCDLMVASEDAFFADPVVSLFGAAAVEVLIHPTVLGMRKAKDLLYTGRRMDAREGFDCGMVSRLVPRVELESATLELAQQIAKSSPFALKLVKRSLHRSMDMQGFRAALNAHLDTHQLSHVSEEFKFKSKPR